MGDVIELRARPQGDHGASLPASGDLYVPGGFLDAINAVPITGADMKRAIDLIRPRPVRSQSDIAEHGRILERFARERSMGDYGGAAFHARAIAMDRWCQLHDPFGETDPDGFYAAGATAPLVESDEGLAFDPDCFRERIGKWALIFA